MAIPYSRPRGAIHSLAHISTLSASRNRLLCVSDRTLYLLGNLSALDITMQSRWVEEFSLEVYTAVSVDSPGFDLYRDSVNAFQLEVMDVSCDIVASLAEIRDAILQIQAQNQALATVCCSYAFDPSTYYEAPPGTGSPPDKCLLSYAYALAWADAEIELYHQWAVGGIFPSIGVLAAILDEFDLPGQALLAIVSLGASNVLPMLESLWAIAVNNLIVPITCAIYYAVDTASAKVAVLGAIEASGAGGVALELLQAPITNEGLNKVFDGTFPTEGVIAPDCEAFCTQEGDIFQTSFGLPWNVLVLGESINSWQEDASYGWRTRNPDDHGFLYFNVIGDIATWEWSLQVLPEDDFVQYYSINLDKFIDGSWQTQKNWTANITPLDWNHVVQSVLDAPLSTGAYRFVFNTQGFNLHAKWRAFSGYTT